MKSLVLKWKRELAIAGFLLAGILLTSVLTLNLPKNSEKKAKKLLFREWPMIMAHDAATTYLLGNSVEVRFARTQPTGGIRKLLDCGTRAFDIRAGPKVYSS